MNLKELTDVIFVYKNDNEYGSRICGKELLGIKNLLLETDEFKDVDELIIMERPMYEGKEGDKSIVASTYKLRPDDKLIGKCYLHSIMNTPTIYEPTINYHETLIKNNACITPMIYDPINFIPNKDIVIRWNPEYSDDITNHSGYYGRKKIHDLLDDILDNPKEYEHKGIKGLMIRGKFNITKNIEK